MPPLRAAGIREKARGSGSSCIRRGNLEQARRTGRAERRARPADSALSVAGPPPRHRSRELLDARRRHVGAARSARQRGRPLRGTGRQYADAPSRLPYRQRAQRRTLRWAAWRRHRHRGGEGGLPGRQALPVRPRGHRFRRRRRRALCYDARRLARTRRYLRRKGARRARREHDLTARGADRLRLRSVAGRGREALIRPHPGLCRGAHRAGRCWKRKVCRSASSPRSTA